MAPLEPFSLLESYLPSQPGLLPKWMLFVSILSLLNTLQTYTTTSFTRRVYSRGTLSNQTTSLQSRTFGTWTLLTGIVRFYAAYRLDDPDWYGLAFATYGVALWHFGSELVWYRTTKVYSGAFWPDVVAVGTVLWMGRVRGGYVGGGGWW